MESLKIKEWLENNHKNNSGYGDYSRSGYGNGSGVGSGEGCGSKDMFGKIDGHGYGQLRSLACGNGYGDGSGGGFKDYIGEGLKEINNNTIWYIDGLPTIITHIKGKIAKGFILKMNFTMQSCYVIKDNGYFVHGETIREAKKTLAEK